jgi:hypothetical protein
VLETLSFLPSDSFFIANSAGRVNYYFFEGDFAFRFPLPMTLYSGKGRAGQVHFLHVLRAFVKISLDTASFSHYTFGAGRFNQMG